jgi:hypothetical protein
MEDYCRVRDRVRANDRAGSGAVMSAVSTGLFDRRRLDLDHDAIKCNRIMISSLCLSLISAQTRFAFGARENRFPLFRISLRIDDHD